MRRIRWPPNLESVPDRPPSGEDTQNPTLSPPLSERISRASSGLASSSPRPSTIWRACLTCMAFDSASLPGPIHSESSSPTRTLPPMAAAMQAVGGAPHVHHVLRMRADAAQDAEHRLHEERRLDHAALGKMRQRVEMADVVALDLEFRAVLGE